MRVNSLPRVLNEESTSCPLGISIQWVTPGSVGLSATAMRVALTAFFKYFLSEGGMYTFLCFKKPCVFSSRSALLNTSSMSSFLRCSDTQEKFLQLCDIFASNAHNKILNKEPAGFKSPNTCVGSFISRLTFGSIGVLKPRHSSFPCKSSRIDSTTAFASNLSACAVDAKESSTYMRARILSKRAKPA